MVIVPILIFFLISAVVVKYYMINIDKITFSIQTPEFNRNLYKAISNDPEYLLSKQNINELIQHTVSPLTTSAFVLLEDKLYIQAGQKIPLPPKEDERRYTNSWLLYLDDGRKVEIFLTNNAIDTQKYSYIIFGPIIIYLVLISLLTFLTSKGIIKPLKLLRNAAIDIKNEEFDKPIIYNKKDEMREVFTAFEEMRVKLKNTIRKQIKFEENRRELLANISHDLKTPITAIKGYIEGIVDGVANTPEKIERYHKTIYKKINLLNNLIENLFLFSKLDLKTEVFNFQKIELNQYLNDVVEEVKFDSPNTQITFKSTESAITANIDPIQIQRVINNLIGNSIKYSDKELTNIHVELTHGDMIRISVKDNGPGIRPEALGSIFKRFYRSDPARSSSTEGSGLGLSIAREIIHAHNGYITAYNNLKEGVTISFSLPVLVEV